MKKETKIIIGVASALAVTIGVVLLIRYFRKNKVNKKTLVCSHIGSYDGQDDKNAENQLHNIKKLVDNKIDMVEVDVQITKDNVPVLFHDNTLDAKTNGSGNIQSKTFADLSTIRYKKDSSCGITKLKDAIDYIRTKNSRTILQLDKTDTNEIERIYNLGYFKGVENNILCKGKSFEKPAIVKKAGVMWMPIIPDSYVGRMNDMKVIDELVSKLKGSDFVEAQFSDKDTLLIDGTFAKKLSEINCKLLIIAVGGTNLTNGKSFRGDSKAQWSKMINPMGAGAIMTNKPLALKNYIDSI